MKKHLKNKKGFTLIELLVVVAIIGLLASIVLASLASARARGRDAQRLAEMDQIRTALQLYANDHAGQYPSTGGGDTIWYGNCASWGSYGTSGATGYIPNLAPTYIPVLPLDPNPIPPTQCYIYTSDGTNYMFLAYFTVEVPANTIPSSLDRPAHPTENDYAIYTAGASGW